MSITCNETDLAAAESTADLFSLLSQLLLPPTHETAEGVLTGAVRKDVQDIFGELGLGKPESAAYAEANLLAAETPEEALCELRRAYTRLFTHPQAPLVAITEMRFRDLRDGAEVPSTAFLNQAALHAEQCYRQAGLALSESGSREPSDHMAIELEFIAHAHVKLAASLASGNEDNARIWSDRIEEFRPHLTSWGADFFTACERSGCGAFYPWLGAVGRAFLEQHLN